MFTIPNQSSVPKAYTQFTDEKDPSNDDDFVEAEGGSRLMPSSNRDRLVDCMEEFVKYTIIMRQHFDLFNDRHSERTERESKQVKDDNMKIESGVKAGQTAGLGGTDLVHGIDINGI